MEIRYGVSEYDFSINEYEVIIDGDDIIYYRDTNDDAFYQNDQKYLCKTRKEAQEIAEKLKAELHNTCKEVKRTLERLERLSSMIVDRKEYLTDDILDSMKSGAYNSEYHALAEEYITHGIINVKGMSFEKDKVSHIRWGKDCAEITLEGGSSVVVDKSYELSFIKDIFGCNNSSLYWAIDK